MNVAIINYHWMIQIHTMLFANYFDKYENNVHIISYDGIGDYCSNEGKNIFFHFLNRNIFVSILYKILKKIYIKIPITNKILSVFFILINLFDMYCVYKYVKKIHKHFDIIIGIEKGGGFIANYCCRKFKIPFIYYSLELYSSDSMVFLWEPLLCSLLKFEKKFAKYADMVIIQDIKRAEFLKTYTGINLSKVHFFPISVLDNSSLMSDKRENICICFGNIYISKEDLLFIACHLPDGWKLILHNMNMQTQFKEISCLNNIIVCDNVLDENGICALLDKSKIALAIYEDDNQNNRLIVFSSEKIARYTCHSIPFIINSTSNANILFSEFKCGIAVSTKDDIIDAISSILSDYDTYAQYARMAFEKYYNFEKNFSSFYSSLLVLTKCRN